MHAAGHATPTARLTGVSTKTEGPGTTVVIATTEPVAYVAAQPDPLTLLVDLRNVAPGEVRPGPPAGAIARMAVEPGTDDDGTSLARVRMLLAKPATPSIRSRLNEVIVEFDGTAADTPRESGASAASHAGDARPAPVAPAPGSALTKVEATTGPSGTRVAFSGTGSFRPGAIEPARDMPPRLVVDFPEIRSTLPPVTKVGLGPVDRVRVAVNRVNPLVTRAVIDLKYAAAHRVEPSDNGVVIVFDEPAAPKPAGPEAAPRPRVPETAAEPRPEPKRVAPAVVQTAPQPVIVAPPAAPVQPSVTAEAAPAPAAESAAPEPKAAEPASKPAAPEPKPAAPEPKPAAPSPRQGKMLPQKPASLAVSGERQYTGHLITFDFYQADLRSVLRTFAEISGLNIVIDPAVPAGTVDVSLREVPWDQALEVILRSHQLGYVLEQNVVRIAPLKALAQEETERQKLVEAQAMSGQLKVFTKTLSYARATDVAKLLKDTRVLSMRGSALVDDRTNTLIINDLQEALDECENLIGILDRSEAQVEIEAKIVQTGTDTARALGVQ